MAGSRRDLAAPILMSVAALFVWVSVLVSPALPYAALVVIRLVFASGLTGLAAWHWVSWWKISRA